MSDHPFLLKQEAVYWFQGDFSFNLITYDCIFCSGFIVDSVSMAFLCPWKRFSCVAFDIHGIYSKTSVAAWIAVKSVENAGATPWFNMVVLKLRKNIKSAKSKRVKVKKSRFCYSSRLQPDTIPLSSFNSSENTKHLNIIYLESFLKNCSFFALVCCFCDSVRSL